MSDQRVTTLQDVMEYMHDVGRQSKLIIEDAVETLYKETKCHFAHVKSWDYAFRPDDHFLSSQFLISRAWVTYIPEGHLSLAALFYLHFRGTPSIVPALMYGSLDPGSERTFDQVSKWAPLYTIREVEKGKDGISVEQDGPLSIVTSARKDCFSEARLVRVPLESITGWEELQRIVVKPLAALVQGEVRQAKELLKGVETIAWPVRYEGAEEEEGEEVEGV